MHDMVADSLNPIEENTRVVIIHPDAGPFLAVVGTVIGPVHEAGCMNLQLEEPVKIDDQSYYFVHVGGDQVERSAYQGEEIVSCDRHD